MPHLEKRRISFAEKAAPFSSFHDLKGKSPFCLDFNDLIRSYEIAVNESLVFSWSCI